MTHGHGQRRIGAVEGGGTKFVCVVAAAPDQILARTQIPTRDPASTLADCVSFFAEAGQRFGPVDAIGLACFGPLQLRADASDFGHLLPTPKAGWSAADVVGPFRRAFGKPVTLDTDVGSAAHGEWQRGAGAGAGSLAYVTVGTGIGGAVVPVGARGLLHAEMGHLPVRRDERDRFPGLCPFHGDCLEGLANGPAIRARWGSDLAELPADHEGRGLIAGYLSQLAMAIALLHAPERLVIGGGVAAGGRLLPDIRRALHDRLGGYLPPLKSVAQIERFVIAPGLGADSAIVGALLQATEALDGESRE